MRHAILNVVCTIHLVNPRCHVLGLKHAVGHLFQCLYFSFNNTLLLRGIGDKVLILNVKFSTKIFECLNDTLNHVICAYFIYRKRGLLLKKIFEDLKSRKDLTLVLMKVQPRVTWEVINKGKCKLGPIKWMSWKWH